MKVILIMVSSVNGKITNGNDHVVSHWSSPQDAKLFLSLKASHDVIIMGRKTYEEAKRNLALNEDKLRIVLTKNPQQYAREAIPGRLEFTAELPAALYKRLESRGYNEVLLTGGGEINSMFLTSGLVDELHLTIEPKLFGTGKNLLSEEELQVGLRLTEVRKLNDTGSLHLIYKIMKRL